MKGTLIEADLCQQPIELISLVIWGIVIQSNEFMFPIVNIVLNVTKVIIY